MARHYVHALGAGETEIEEQRFLGFRRRRILRFLPDPEGGTLVAALVEGITVNGIPLLPGTAMLAQPGDKVVLPDGKAYITVEAGAGK